MGLNLIHIMQLLTLFSLISLCYSKEVTKLEELLGSTTTPIQDYRQNVCVSDPSVFQCDFTNKCPFGASSDSPWYKLDGSPDYQIWTESVGTATSANLPSAAVQLGGDTPYGLLLSDPIPCVANGATLYTKFWSNKNVMLQVCFVSKTTSKEIFCSDQMNQQTSSYPGSVAIEIPQSINEAFFIQFMASTEPGVEAFLILDEIYFSAFLCDSPPTVGCNSNGNNNTVITTQEPPIMTVPPTNSPSLSNICEVVPCNFENGWCQIENFDSSGVQFQRRNSPYGPPVIRLFDIRTTSTTGYFLSAMINAKTYDVAVLSSPEFEPSDNKQLTFKYFRAVNGHTLKICFDTNFVTYTNKILMAQCDVAIPPLTGSNAQTWNDVAIQIPNTATKFYLVAMNDNPSNSNGPLAVDDMSILGC